MIDFYKVLETLINFVSQKTTPLTSITGLPSVVR